MRYTLLHVVEEDHCIAASDEASHRTSLFNDIGKIGGYEPGMKNMQI